MGAKGVLRNIKNKGIKETGIIFLERHIGKEVGRQLETIKKDVANIEKEIQSIEKEKQFAERETEIKMLIRMAEAEAEQVIRTKILEKIRELESLVGYKTYIKRKYIKSVLPKVYDAYSVLPVKKEMVFMQPRKGLNGSCQYIFHKIQEQQEYTPVLYELDRDNVPVTLYYENAVKWVKALATAKACFVHESNDLMGYLNIRKETKIIQLWHGCGVLKKIGLSTADKKDFKSAKTYEEFPEYNKYDMVTIASPELSWVFEEFMGIDKESGIISPIGVSRTDEFFDEEYINNCYKKLYERIPQAKEKKVILYAPTYRGVGQQRVAPDALDIKKFADALSEDYILIIKQHQTVKNLPEIPEEYRNKFAFDMTRGKGMNINELMTVSDICISDYSSLVFEYALFERPIIFFVYDLEEYIDNRGLYYDFDEITPGPICRTNDEMIEYIAHINEKFDKQVVTDFKNKFMCSCDGHSTERILRFAEE